MKIRLKGWMKWSLSVLVCLGAGAVGSIATAPNISVWYASLHKPFFNPPNWIFGPVWSTLYVLMGTSFYLVWRKGSQENRHLLTDFALQLVLNILWSFIFFGWKHPAWAFAEILLLWSVILWVMVGFYNVSKLATWLLAPYLAWVSFASLLNYYIWRLNP